MYRPGGKKQKFYWSPILNLYRLKNSSCKFLKFRYSAGSCGERKACRYLRKHSYKIMDVNWRCQAGEIDIVASREKTLIFIEVKTRHVKVAEDFPPAHAVDRRKQDKLRLLARIYLDRHHRMLKRERITLTQFDIIALTYTRRALGLFTCFSVEHLQDAFTDD